MVGALNKKHAYTLKARALAGVFYCFIHLKKPINQHPIPGTNSYFAPPGAGFFHGCGVCTPSSYWDLSGSPELHQNFEGSTPELCSGGHQKGCDLEEVEGAAPRNPNIHSLKQ